jgi:hypothetical protein
VLSGAPLSKSSFLATLFANSLIDECFEARFNPIATE